MGQRITRPTQDNNQGAITSNGTYFGPQFVFHANGQAVNGSTPMYFDEVMNILAANVTADTGIPVPQLPPAQMRTTKTLKAFVNLVKNSIRVKPTDRGTSSIEFQFDALKPCMIKIYIHGRELFQNDHGKTRYKIVDKAGNPVQPFVFGPFPAGLNQTFVDREGINLDNYKSEDLYRDPQQSPLAQTPSTPLSAVSPNAPLLPSPVGGMVTAGPLMYPVVIAIEAIETPGAHADQIGNLNTQTTFGAFVHPESGVGIKILKQSMLIDGQSFMLQEIFGFSENEGETVSVTGGSRDCVVCMSDAKNTVVLPCRHLCLCGSCAEVLRMQGRSNNGVQQRNQGPPRCPICRQIFHSLLQIELPEPFVTRTSRQNSKVKIDINTEPKTPTIMASAPAESPPDTPTRINVDQIQ
ncbi:hypothetical protein EDD86DRAFT_188067 [Gorgonomyces haynaldii]|nr:hypothetical protein EDD86DRAFT_188067 [Gorgonomyces haynaldii]